MDTQATASGESMPDEFSPRHLRARIVQLDLSRADRLEPGYDKVFAVNVNLFWTGQARRELEILAALMRPGATLQLYQETPTPGRSAALAAAVAGALRAGGFAPRTIAGPTPAMFCIKATRPAG